MKKALVLITIIFSAFTLFACGGENRSDWPEETQLLAEWLEKAHEAENMTVTTEVIRSGVVTETYTLYMNEDIAYFVDFVNHPEYYVGIMHLYMVDKGEDWRMYARRDDKTCFDENDRGLTRNDILTILQEPARRKMIPTSIRPSWFERDGNVFTLLDDHFDEMRRVTSTEGTFTRYTMRVTEDEFVVEIRLGFPSRTIRITYSDVDETVIDVPDFNLCD